MMLISFDWPTTCTLHQGKTGSSLIPDIPATRLKNNKQKGNGKESRPVWDVHMHTSCTISWAGVTQSRRRRALRDSGSSPALEVAKETNVYTNTCKYLILPPLHIPRGTLSTTYMVKFTEKLSIKDAMNCTSIVITKVIRRPYLSDTQPKKYAPNSLPA